ncbi:hypothetical protein AVEN_100912-1 [Araneus ventricosus]|uniref:Uncharacterized protein n=1 Tax=Araneus ventricosus TaxID=182803 RepID=A0A4Y2AW21_ARAVE|nr:hypothetical protein AVEN_100912-1 [Araneus ventricosus]
MLDQDPSLQEWPQGNAGSSEGDGGDILTTIEEAGCPSTSTPRSSRRADNFFLSLSLESGFRIPLTRFSFDGFPKKSESLSLPSVAALLSNLKLG